MRRAFGRVGSEGDVGQPGAQCFEHVAADEHHRRTEPRQFDEIGQCEALIRMQELQREIAREAREIGWILLAETAFGCKRDVAPIDHPPWVIRAEHGTIRPPRHRLNHRKHVIRGKIDIGVDEQHVGAIAREEHRCQYVARPRDRRLIEDELEPHRNAQRLRLQRQIKRRADIGALRPVIDGRRHHQAAIGEGRVDVRHTISLPPPVREGNRVRGRRRKPCTPSRPSGRRAGSCRPASCGRTSLRLRGPN